jgi:hypothetical protein
LPHTLPESAENENSFLCHKHYLNIEKTTVPLPQALDESAENRAPFSFSHKNYLRVLRRELFPLPQTLPEGVEKGALPFATNFT